MLNIVGIEGPKISASTSPTLYPSFARETEILEDIVDLPTPPFPEDIAIMFLIFLIFIFSSFLISLLLIESDLFLSMTNSNSSYLSKFRKHKLL